MGSSTTTRNFGMRRFTNLVREGRFRAPATGTPLRLGTLVEVDPNDTDYVRQAVDHAIGGSGDSRTGLCGVLWYEHDAQTFNTPPFGGAAGQLVQDLDWAPNGRLVQVLRGRGPKIWLRNTAANTTEPGLNFASDRDEVIMVDGIGIATPTVSVGELLGWDDTNKYYTVTTNADEAVMRVTALYNDLAMVDAELIL